jgi:hypothetical protein
LSFALHFFKPAFKRRRGVDLEYDKDPKQTGEPGPVVQQHIEEGFQSFHAVTKLAEMGSVDREFGA